MERYNFAIRQSINIQEKSILKINDNNKIKTIDNKKKTAKKSVSTSGSVNKYEFLTSKDVLPKNKDSCNKKM